MDGVERDIAIGNYLEAKDCDLLRKESISSGLSLDGTPAGIAPSSLGLKRIEVVRLEDGPGNDLRLFRRALDILETLVREVSSVLVQCHAGRSRSVVVVAGYLMKRYGIDSRAALVKVGDKRQLGITPGLEALPDKLSQEDFRIHAQ